MLIAKPSDFVKSYDFKDISASNVAKLGEYFKTLSVKERRENLFFLIDDLDFDIPANNKWLSIYKEDIEYIMQENTEALEEDDENIQQTYDYIINQSQAYKDWMTFFGYKIDEKLKIVYDTLSDEYSINCRLCLIPNAPNSLSFTDIFDEDAVDTLSSSEKHDMSVKIVKKIATVILYFKPDLHFDYDLSQEKQELDSLIQKHQSGDNNEFIALIKSFIEHRKFLYQNVALRVLDFAQMNDESIFMLGSTSSDLQARIERSRNDLWKKFNRSFLSEFDEDDVLHIQLWDIHTKRSLIKSLTPEGSILADYHLSEYCEPNKSATKESFAMLVNFVKLLKS